jgi:MinD-like ATPase involved in chromosome partitioning or flagellar assembly
MGKPAPTVVVASDDPVLLDEIVRHLEELPAWRLAGWAAAPGELLGLAAAHHPDAVIVSAGLAAQLQPGAALPGTRIVVVATEPDPGILRCSLRLGAGFVLWPQERHTLRDAVEAGLPAPEVDRARLVAVWSPKGGSGASVLAAHLAGAAAGGRGGDRCLLLDLDLSNGDQRALLGVAGHDRSLLDLLAAGDDLSPSSVEGVTWRHPAGFGVVLAPPPGPPLPEDCGSPEAVAAAVDAIREGGGLLVADLPSGLGRFPVGMAARSDAVALVVTPDLLSLRRARDAARALEALAGDADAGLVLNRWSRGSGLSPGDVEAVLGRPVWARVALQEGLLRSPDLGRLSRPAVRALGPLAARVSGPGDTTPVAALSTAGGRR